MLNSQEADFDTRFPIQEVSNGLLFLLVPLVGLDAVKRAQVNLDLLKGLIATVGAKTSMIFFKRLLASEICWCGSGKAFGKCHRRDDDWTYVSLDPDRTTYSSVVLIERTFAKINFAHARQHLANEKRLLCIDYTNERAEWAIPAHPPIVNETEQLVIGSVEVTDNGLRLESNSEKRLEHITGSVTQLLGDLGKGETRRAEPQKTFAVPGAR